MEKETTLNLLNRRLTQSPIYGSGKTALLKEAAHYNFSFLNFGEELSRRLLSRPAYLRAAEAEVAVIELVDQVGGTRLALDNTEVLFEPPIQLNPLALLKRLSIHRTVVATWNGHFDDSRLIYGFKGHPAYHEFKYTKKDTFIIVPSGSTVWNTAISFNSSLSRASLSSVTPIRRSEPRRSSAPTLSRM